MEDLKVVFASNLIKLRNQANLTQAELAEKINYSDKSVSKWERAEALPDLAVANSIAEQFGVTVDFMLNIHDDWEKEHIQRPFSAKMVVLVTMTGIWTLALLIFVIFWIIGFKLWMIFIAAVPVSLITLLVLNTIWLDTKYNRPIVCGIVLSIFAVIYYALIQFNPWQLILVAVPAELIAFLSFKIKIPK